MIEVLDRAIGEDAPTFFISEIGTNFNTLPDAELMIRASADAGASAVKFQTYRADTVALPGATFVLDDGSEISQYDYFKSRELSRDTHLQLKQLSEELGLVFFSTPGYYDDVELLEEVGVPLYKIGSDDLTNYPFLKHVAALQKPIMLSTGMCSLGEIDSAVEAIATTGNDSVVLMHCVVSYPARAEDANVRVIETLRSAFGFPVGMSDHFRDSTAGILSTAFGAVSLEKHLTLDRSKGGPDNDVACEPHELRLYIEDVKRASAALGSSSKRLLPTEIEWRKAARKSVVAKRDILPGEVLTPDMLTVKRPSTGLHPHFLEIILGQEAIAAIAANDLVSLESLRPVSG